MLPVLLNTVGRPTKAGPLAARVVVRPRRPRTDASVCGGCDGATDIALDGGTGSPLAGGRYDIVGYGGRFGRGRRPQASGGHLPTRVRRSSRDRPGQPRHPLDV